jgi:hypothetical protein
MLPEHGLIQGYHQSKGTLGWGGPTHRVVGISELKLADLQIYKLKYQNQELQFA